VQPEGNIIYKEYSSTEILLNNSLDVPWLPFHEVHAAWYIQMVPGAPPQNF
jgi:hypothetical protein